MSASTPQAILKDGDYNYALRGGVFMRASTTHLAEDGQSDWRIVRTPAASPDERLKLDQLFTDVLALDTEGSLCEEYDAWCLAQGLPQISADEQDLEALTFEQRHYLHGFILRWERAVGEQRLPEGRLSYESWAFGDLSAADQ